jgi:hypothetical protein
MFHLPPRLEAQPGAVSFVPQRGFFARTISGGLPE